jgi:TetR/AcrR family transcriptional repressor of nem operon
MTPTMPRTRTLNDETVLDRVTSVFWRRGYAATSLRDLTEATGLSTAALCQRFNDKEGLFLESLRRYADQGLTDRFARLSALGSPVSAVRTFFDELIGMSAEDPDQLGCFLVYTVLDGAATSPDAAALVREKLGDVETFFRSSLQPAHKASLIEVTLKPAALAEILLSAILAIRVLARLDPDRTRLRRLADNALLPLIRQARART